MKSLPNVAGLSKKVFILDPKRLFTNYNEAEAQKFKILNYYYYNNSNRENKQNEFEFDLNVIFNTYVQTKKQNKKAVNETLFISFEASNIIDPITKSPLPNNDKVLCLFDNMNVLLVNYKNFVKIVQEYYTNILEDTFDPNLHIVGEVMLQSKWINILVKERYKKDKLRGELEVYLKEIKETLDNWNDKLSFDDKFTVLGSEDGKALQIEKDEVKEKSQLVSV